MIKRKYHKGKVLKKVDLVDLSLESERKKRSISAIIQSRKNSKENKEKS